MANYVPWPPATLWPRLADPALFGLDGTFGHGWRMVPLASAGWLLSRHKALHHLFITWLKHTGPRPGIVASGPVGVACPGRQGGCGLPSMAGQTGRQIRQACETRRQVAVRGKRLLLAPLRVLAPLVGLAVLRHQLCWVSFGVWGREGSLDQLCRQHSWFGVSDQLLWRVSTSCAGSPLAPARPARGPSGAN
jgi:hypothetical protein